MPQSIGRSEPAAPVPQTAFMTAGLSKSAASSFVSICDDPKTVAGVTPCPKTAATFARITSSWALLKPPAAVESEVPAPAVTDADAVGLAPPSATVVLAVGAGVVPPVPPEPPFDEPHAASPATNDATTAAVAMRERTIVFPFRTEQAVTRRTFARLESCVVRVTR
jgi:hypothetical protein